MRVGESAGRTGRYALAAEFAVFQAARFTEGRLRHGLEAAVDDRNGPGHHHFVADPGTATADDAFIRFKGDERIVLTDRQLPFFARKSAEPGPVAVGQILQRAGAGRLTAHAVIGMVGEQEFDDGLAQTGQLRAFGGDHHAGLGRSGAGGQGSRHSFDLHDTEPTAAIGLQAVVMTEGRYGICASRQTSRMVFPFSNAISLPLITIVCETVHRYSPCFGCSSEWEIAAFRTTEAFLWRKRTSLGEYFHHLNRS